MNTPLRCRAGTAGLLILATLTLTQCSLVDESDDPFPLEATLDASDATLNNRFGDQVALDGDHALVQASISKALYFYRWDGAAWNQEHVLFLGTSTAFVHNGDIADHQGFGGSLALVGTRLVVGAGWAKAQRTIATGAVYLYRRTGTSWQREDRIDSPDPAATRFGAAVSASGQRFLVGAPGSLPEDQGKAYVYAGLQP